MIHSELFTSMRIFISFIIMTSLVLHSGAQDTTFLSLEGVLKMTLAYHPVVQQASILDDDAKAVLRQARGQLDPKLALDYQLKDFKETEYYNLLSTSLKVPTWVGIEPKLEFNRNLGEHVNEQNYISSSTDYRQMALGFTVPIGKGLFFDERRNTIRQAQAFTQIANAEQTKQTNKILLTVVKDYWNWYVAYQRSVLLSQAVGLAENIFDRTLTDYEFGEAAVVDTLQAKINYQKRIVDHEKALLDYELSKLELSKHLWSAELLPLELQATTLPDSISLFFAPAQDNVGSDVVFALENHPEINKLEGKRSQLDAQQRWNKESIKPALDVSYSFIDAPIDPFFEGNAIDLGENYKLGVDFSFPLLLRKERGKIQQTQLKIESNEYEMAQNQLNVKNEVLGQYAQSSTLQNLLKQYQGVSVNYRLLLDAEIINLQNGETDLFKLNIQQDKYIEAQSDFYEAFIKWEKSKASYYHATGQPFLGLTDLLGE